MVSFLTHAQTGGGSPFYYNNPEVSYTRRPGASVRAFAEDAQGRIWMGTREGLSCYNGAFYVTWFASDQENSLRDDNINTLAFNGSGDLWVANEAGAESFSHGRFYHRNKTVFDPLWKIVPVEGEIMAGTGLSGLVFFNSEGLLHTFLREGVPTTEALAVNRQGLAWVAGFGADGAHLYGLGSDARLRVDVPAGPVPIRNLELLSDGHLWTLPATGLRRFNAFSGEEMPLPTTLKELVHGQQVLFAVPYGSSSVLLGIRQQGLFLFSFSTGEWKQIQPQEKLEGDRYTAFVDSRFNIWLSNRMDQVQLFRSERNLTHLSAFLQPEDGNLVLAVATDSKGYLWIITDHRLYCLEPESGELVFSEHSEEELYALYIDDKDRLWASAGRTTLRCYRLGRGTATRLWEGETEAPILSIVPVAPDELLILGGDQFLSATVTKGQPELSRPHIEGKKRFTRAHFDRQNRKLLIGSTDGDWYEFTPDHRLIAEDLPDSISPTCILTDRDGSRWYGTRNSGLYHYLPSESRFEHVGQHNGLMLRSILGLEEASDGGIWVYSEKLIARIDPRTQDITTFADEAYLTYRSYSTGCSAIVQDRLFVGGMDGLTRIDLSAPLSKGAVPPVSIQLITVNTDNRTEIPEKLYLEPGENNLSFYYAGISFDNVNLVNYACRLDGVDNDWFPTNQFSRSYSGLRPGDYTFRVKARLLNGEWSEEAKLPVHIRAPFYATPFAKGIYWFLGIALLVFGLWIRERWRLSKERLKLAREREALQQSHIDLVTNIAHEFKTPLTMVYGPAQQLSAETGLSDKGQDLVKLIQNASRNLRALTDQILTTSTERSKEELKVSENDLSALLYRLTENMRYAFSEKDLDLQLDLPQEAVCWTDDDKIMKIFMNLISNAVKYTPEHGHIRIGLTEDDGNARISVQDDGIGIPEEKRQQIFDRFERLGVRECEGSGIGLHYAQQLAHMHKGQIYYEPAVGGGSIFTLEIPTSTDAYTPEEKLTKNASSQLLTQDLQIPEHDENARTVLVVEDNLEVRLYLQYLLSSQYNVLLAPDGEAALDTLRISMPDLILSDVMMPRKDGYALCREVKENEDWHHIPVILLTAKADKASHVKGLDIGADAYIPKPFDPDILLAEIQTLLRNREKMQQRILQLTPETLESVSEEESGLTAMEKRFLEKVHQALEEHLDNAEFNVDTLASEVAVSYSSLYAKVKALTGQTPQQYVNAYRMNRAAELLRSGEYTVSEVADRVGTSSPANFSRVFKKYFGVSPSDFLKK